VCSSDLWEKYQPLRWSLSRDVLDGSMDGWEILQSHPIFGIRAGFELGQSSNQDTAHSRRKGTLSDSPCA
jgi:hypothetical protein